MLGKPHEMSPEVFTTKSERIRVLKFVSLFMLGGTEHQFVAIAKNLDRTKFELHLACFQKTGALLPEIEACGYPLQDYNFSGFFSRKAVQAIFRLARYLRANRIQVVHSYGLYPNLFVIPAAALARVPVKIAGVRDIGAYTRESQHKAQRLVCKLADCVLANSDAVQKWLSDQGIPSEKIRVIRNGVDVDAGCARSHISSLREELGIPQDAPLVGSVGRLSAVKGYEYLLEAATIVLRRHPQARFVIVGGGYHQKPLEACRDSLGLTSHVTFTGSRKDARLLFREFDVSVLPSLSEGFSNSLLESMAAGAPTVATRVGGTPEVLIDGVNGILVEPADAAALAASIIRLIECKPEARRLGQEARRTITTQFSIDKATRAIEGMYHELMDHYV